MEGVNPTAPPRPQGPPAMLRQEITPTVLNTPSNPVCQPPPIIPQDKRPRGQLLPPPVIPPLRPNPRPFCRSGQIQLTVQRSRSTLPARRVFKQIQWPASTWGPSVGSLGDGCCGLALLGLERSIPALWWGLFLKKRAFG